MLRLVLVVTQSGIVLYKKEFQRLVAQPGLTGSLLAAMLDLCLKTVQRPLSYIEMTTVAVATAADLGAGRTGLLCALFTDVGDGAAFGTALAAETLAAFLDAYPDAIDGSRVVVDTSVFANFHARMPECLRGTAKRVLTDLAATKGVSNCVLVHNSSVAFATAQTDELGLVANLNAMLDTTRDIMALPEDKARSITVQGRRSNLVVGPLAAGGALVVVLKKSANAAALQPAIDTARELIDRAYECLASLHGAA